MELYVSHPGKETFFLKLKQKYAEYIIITIHIPNPRTHQHKTINKQIVCLLFPELTTNIDTTLSMFLPTYLLLK